MLPLDFGEMPVSSTDGALATRLGLGAATRCGGRNDRTA